LCRYHEKKEKKKDLQEFCVDIMGKRKRKRFARILCRYHEKKEKKKKRVTISKYKMKNPSCRDGKIPLTKVSSKFTRKFLVGLLCATPPPCPHLRGSHKGM
jgi:hypothetical protein